MGKYSIKELEQLSGIKAHTIRIWEKRHRIIQPHRTATNIRYYSDDDLKKIINVSLLNNHGLKISKIVNLSDEEISKKVIEISSSANDSKIYIDHLILSMIDLQEDAFEKSIGSLTLKFGFEKTVLDIIYPFLEKVGVMWHSGMINPAQEHFISQLIRQKIIVAIDSLPSSKQKAETVVLFLPENELHELGLLFYHYLARKQGFKTYYLGQTVPYGDVKFVCSTHSPKFIITSVTTDLSKGQIAAFINNLCSDFPNSQVLLGGRALKKQQLHPATNLTVFDTAHALKTAFNA